MESILNLAWLALAAATAAVWLRLARRSGVSRGRQLVALGVLALILFPVISATDDLLAAQNPAEADSCLRKDHAAAHQHSTVPVVAAQPAPVVVEVFFGFLGFTGPGGWAIPTVDHPGLSAVQNRPPPAA